MKQSGLVFLITLWFSLELATKASMITQENIFFPLPTNLKVHLYPGIINVTWNCNITKSMAEHTYHIEFPRGTKENINISKCFHEHFVTDHLEFVIHSGLEVNISSGSEWKFENAMPEGKINTSAENFHCDVYNVSIINCSWTVGREAPKDTQYTMAFRQTPHESQISNPKQNRVYLPCGDYRTDSFGRQVGCVVKAQKICFNVSIYVQLVGSSSETTIQFFDKSFKLDNFVILDPPRNIQLNFSSTELKITWDTPETYSNIESHCFIYSVNINGDIKDDIRNQFYKTSNLHINEKVSVSVRAKWEDFYSYNDKWSRWSDPHIKEPDSTSFTQNHLLLILGILTFAVLFLLIFLCHSCQDLSFSTSTPLDWGLLFFGRSEDSALLDDIIDDEFTLFQIWKRLFPQIPTPAKKILETIEQKELLFLEENIEMKSLPEEDDECICLQVTEIPKKE